MVSRRLRSSGGKYSDVLSKTRFLAWVVMTPLGSHEWGLARMSLPRLLVRQMIVFCACVHQHKGELIKEVFFGNYLEVDFPTLTVCDTPFV